MASLNGSIPEDMRFLIANIEDLFDASESGMTVASAFLNPKEQYFVKIKISQLALDSRAFFYGGHSDSERARLLLFPEYALPMLECSCANVLYEELSGEAAVSIVEIRSSGFKQLSHRDYMGSILALGIDRSAVGDIAVNGENAYVFATPVIAKYICEELERVGRDGVKVALTDKLPDNFQGGAEKLAISDTVASPRLDCIAAALLNISRDAAQTIIRRSEAEQNYAVCESCDEQVRAGDILSFRGYGKFRIVKFGDLNKRGRLRFEAEKYI